MRTVRTNKRFEKDLTLAILRGKNADKLWNIVDHLLLQRPLEARHRNHKLKGDYFPFWECHIEPDWLLIYHDTGTHLELVRTGTHADLF